MTFTLDLADLPDWHPHAFTPRTCAYPGCTTAMPSDAMNWCSEAHYRAWCAELPEAPTITHPKTSDPDTQPCTRRQCRGWTEHSTLRHWLGWWRQ